MSGNYRHATADLAGGSDCGAGFTAPRIVAATIGFGTPYVPALEGLDTFTGTVLHAAAYRDL
ncbi:hypothetical protein [Rhodococcus sp. OK302]|uniref:hypothetical protein n=1 Tax=Rhodococcus sp. OK302 TaxID=1882769 RepID=UPI000B940780|nr:hypothetical protein [Rhodococcus sp. OK302]